MIRRMMSSDIAPIEQLLVSCPEAAQWSPGEVMRENFIGGSAFAAESGEEIVGMAALRSVADEAELLNLAVAPGYRRRGLGRQLLAVVMEHAREDGAGKLFLEVRMSNTVARAFYLRMGFSETGFRRAYYHDPIEDALVLSMLLD